MNEKRTKCSEKGCAAWTKYGRTCRPCRTKKRNDKVVRRYRSGLSRKEIAAVFHLSYITVCAIISDYGNARLPKEKDNDKNPCGLSLKIWPTCYGQGCYLAKKCQAYQATQIKADVFRPHANGAKLR